MPMPSSEQAAPTGIMTSCGGLMLPKASVLASANVPYSASMYMTPKMGSPSHFHLPKESHRPMASEAITVDSGRMIHRKRIENPIAPAPSVKHQNTNSVSIQTARYARGAASSVGRCRGSVLLSGVVAHLVPANKKKRMIKRS